MNTGKVILCMLAGAATGAVFAVLYAPHKGSVTRKKITKKGAKLSGEIKNKFVELEENIQQKIEDVKDEIRKYSGKVNHKASTLKSKME